MTAVRSEPTRRLPRAQRREQVLDAAAPTFARAGFANTGLDVIAAEAGVTKVSLYRFFASKADLYREVLHRAGHRLREAVGADDFDEASLPALTRAATADPDGFRLLFRYATREPQFRDVAQTHRCTSTEITGGHLAAISDDRWRTPIKPRSSPHPHPPHCRRRDPGRPPSLIHGRPQKKTHDQRCRAANDHGGCDGSKQLGYSWMPGGRRFFSAPAVLVSPACRWSTPSIRVPYLRRHFLPRVGRGADQATVGWPGLAKTMTTDPSKSWFAQRSHRRIS